MFVVFEVIQKFLETGGIVLGLILIACLSLWILIVERFVFFKRYYPQLSLEIINKWNSRKISNSWHAYRIREAQISMASMKLNQNISYIKLIVAVCPLLGLLGTVTGMIAVFNYMAITGSGNARLMASGISMATIPTMAGMVVAISGLYFGSLLENRAKVEKKKLSEALLLT